MKIITLLLITFFLSMAVKAQTKTDTAKKAPVVKPVTVAKQKADSVKLDPNKEFIIKLKARDLYFFMHSAENGFDPWLKTTEIQYKDVDDQRARFDFVLDNVHRQLALQLKPDTAKTKPLPPKK